MKIKEKKNKKAISLIVLVITIIVLSILAATVIISISNTNVIEEANKTVFKSDMSNYKEVFEMYITTETMKDNTFDSTTLDGTYKDNEDTFNKIFGKVESKYQDGITIQDGKLVYKTEDEAEKEILEALGIKSTDAISKTESFVGYYADTDGDGEVDGIIFADLAVGGSGTWNTINDSTYSYEAVPASQLNDYVMSEETYTPKAGESSFAPKQVLTATGTGADRFYVMALSNLGSYKWYCGAMGHSEIESATSTSFGAGKTNTITMVNAWNAETYGTQNANDVWGIIQNEELEHNYQNGWFIPSKDELSAFVVNLNITSSNYSSLGLDVSGNGIGWSSSSLERYKRLGHGFKNGIYDIFVGLNRGYPDFPPSYNFLMY